MTKDIFIQSLQGKSQFFRYAEHIENYTIATIITTTITTTFHFCLTLADHIPELLQAGPGLPKGELWDFSDSFYIPGKWGPTPIYLSIKQTIS